MTDVINLSCKQCGGQLASTSNPTVLRCQHCGREVLLARSIPTSTGGHAACPQCGRNDRVEKASAIIARDTHNLNGTTVQHDSYRDNDGRWITTTTTAPFSGVQVSQLARRLARPSEPSQPSMDNLILWLAAIFYTGATPVALIWAYATLTYSPNLKPGNLLLLLVGCAFPILGAWYMFYTIRKRKRAHAEAMRQHPAALTRWQRACAAWDRLYYCARDDIVFIPGAPISAPADESEAFLYRV